MAVRYLLPLAGVLAAMSVACGGDDGGGDGAATGTPTTGETTEPPVASGGGPVAMLTVAPGPGGAARISIFDLREGDCFDAVDRDDPTVMEVDRVPCDGEWAFQVDDAFNVADAAVFPGGMFFREQANERCPPAATTFFAPTEDSWAEGDRVVLCIAAFRLLATRSPKR